MNAPANDDIEGNRAAAEASAGAAAPALDRDASMEDDVPMQDHHGPAIIDDIDERIAAASSMAGVEGSEQLASIESVLDELGLADSDSSSDDDVMDMQGEQDYDGRLAEISDMLEDADDGQPIISASEVRTRNEIEPPAPTPRSIIQSEIPASATTYHLGSVTAIIADTAIIVSAPGTPVLDVGSVLVRSHDKAVLGEIFDTFGPVQKPMYSVRFASPDEILELDVAVGTAISYVDKASSLVYTEVLKKQKGSDASNIHDEEPGVDEIEFSDDEQEQQHKLRKKKEKISKAQAQRLPRPPAQRAPPLNASSRPNPPAYSHAVPGAGAVLSYGWPAPQSHVSSAAPVQHLYNSPPPPPPVPEAVPAYSLARLQQDTSWLQGSVESGSSSSPAPMPTRSGTMDLRDHLPNPGK